MRVLLADDERDIRDMVTLALRLKQIETSAVADGYAALSAAEAEAFDVIMLDMHMPNINGIDTAKRIRELPAHTDTPILFLTGDDRLDALPVPNSRMVNKPFRMAELVNTLRCMAELETGAADS